MMMDISDWQLECIGIKNRGAQILKSGEFSDCSFRVGCESSQTVSAHKVILAMASPVFRTMFYGSIAAKSDVTIEDIEVDVFKSLLLYIYTDAIEIESVEKACELYYAANKYMLPHLIKECTAYLTSKLSEGNVLMVYEFAKFNENEELRLECMEVIRKDTKKVLNDFSFTKASLETVCTIFSMYSLNIDSELDLFKAAERYLKANEECVFPLKDSVPTTTDALHEQAGEDSASSSENSTSPSEHSQVVEDAARSEATFCFTVQNIENFLGEIMSPPCLIRNLPWQITVESKIKLPGQKMFGFGVACNLNSKSASWSCHASFELRVVGHKPDKKPFYQKLDNWFYGKEPYCGWYDFVSASKLLDPESGFVKDGAITLEAHIVAEVPHGNTVVKKYTNGKDKLTIRNAVRLVRFLSLTAEQFAEGAVNSCLLDNSEERAILINILAKNPNVPMPWGFWDSKIPRTKLNA